MTALLTTLLAQPALIPEKRATALFPGRNQLRLTWTNQGAEAVDMELTANVFQAATELALRLPIDVKDRLRLLPHQAALNTLSIEAPDVRGKTKLIIQWLDGSKIVGKTELDVYPRDILRELATLGAGRLGVASDDEPFKAAFENQNVDFQSIDKGLIESYTGKILLVTSAENPKGAAMKALIAAARRGAVVICVVGQTTERLKPNFFATPFGSGLLIYVQQDWIENFDANPLSQSRLVEICRMAMSPGRRDLPMIFTKDENED